jgi:hypothetical protein
MQRGREILGRIDATVDAARAGAAQAAGALEQARAEHEAAQAAVVAHTLELARLRRDLLASQQVIERIDVGDQRAMALMGSREREVARVAAAIEASLAHQATLAQARAARLAEQEAAQQALAACEARARETLAGSAQAAVLAAAEAAAAQAGRAAQKAAQAESDRETKRRPYEAEPLFMYLWQRRYRFPEYRANALVRALDGWVARLCGYEQAHRDYRMLLDLADRLRAHADRLGEDARQRTAAANAMAEQSLVDAGVAPLREALESARGRCTAAEQALQGEEARHAALIEQRARFAAGEDPLSREALTVLQARMQAEGIDSLLADARSTASPRDDRMVERLADLRAAADAAGRRVAGLLAAQQAALARTHEVESLRQRYRSRGYDGSGSAFLGGLVVGTLLDGLLSGSVQASEAWSTIERHQRFEPDPAAWGGDAGGLGDGGGFETGGGFDGGDIDAGGGF